MYSSRRARVNYRMITLHAGDNIEVPPLQCESAYTRLCIYVYPMGSGPNYKHNVELFLDDYSQELHQYTTDGRLEFTQIIYADQAFIPNVWSEQAPGFPIDPSSAGKITIKVTNNEATTRDFAIYSVFEAYDATVYKLLQ